MNHLLVVGDKEVVAKNVSVESRDVGKIGTVPVVDFLVHMKNDIRKHISPVDTQWLKK
jgi:threonyl-tRNA synthetase